MQSIFFRQSNRKGAAHDVRNGVYEWWCRDNALTALKRDSFISILKANASKRSISYDYNVQNDQGKRVREFKGVKPVYKIRASVGV